MDKQSGFALVKILIALTILLLTAGGVVWKERVLPTITPTPTPSLTEPPAAKPTKPPAEKPAVGQECTYDYECGHLGRCTQSYPPSCLIGQCIDGRCALVKLPTGADPEKCTMSNICKQVNVPFWYFDPRSGKCIQPHAQCGNNYFLTREECERTCLGRE